jgi:hypothetical protein
MKDVRFDIPGLAGLVFALPSLPTWKNFLPSGCGTLNLLGVAGLNAGVRWITEKGIEAIPCTRDETVG